MEAVITLFAVLFGIFIAIIVVVFSARLYIRKQVRVRAGKHSTVTLKILVPKIRDADDIKGPSNAQQMNEDIAITETFFAALGGLKAQYGIKAWLYGRTDEMALEIVSKDGLIYFYITVPKFLQQFLEQQLHAQYPDAHIEEVEDFNIFTPTGSVGGGYLTLRRLDGLPIKTYKEIEGDPLNAVTNALSKIPEGEGVAIQYIIRSAPKRWRYNGTRIVKDMNKGMTFDKARKGGTRWYKGWHVTQKSQDQELQQRREHKHSQADQKMMEGMETKASKAGLDVNIRILVAGKSPQSIEANLNQVLQAYGQYNIYEYGNAFSKNIPSSTSRLVQDFVYRRFHEKYKSVLNIEELASVWHLPLPSMDTPNIEWLGARVQPPPTTIPTEGLHIGFNEYRGTKTEIYMKDKDRRRHAYVIGKTGSGKSYFVRYMAAQDIKAGKGVAVIDPHGDLVDSLMGMIPKERIDDVIYFNPSDMDRPMGLNMLEAPNAAMRDFVVQEMISIFYMLFPPEMIGPMFEHSMRNYMLTLMADVKNPGTIVEIPRMIADKAFQDKWIAKVKDPVVRSFWEDEMANTSDHQKSEMMGYLSSKVGRFVENEMMRNIIGQTKSAFNFREIMDEGKILLVNLSKGKTGEVNANLLGLILVAKLQMAAFGRADMAEEDRKDFVLYIDEFQNFITPSIATILSEARKYRLSLVLAHQYMGQLVKDGKTEIRDAVLGNVGSMFVARVGPEDTDVLGKIFEPTFSPYDLMNTGMFTWNVKMIIDNSQERPFTMKAVPPGEPNVKLSDALKEVSRLTYGQPRDLVEREIAIRSGIGAKKKAPAPKGMKK